LSLFQGVIMVRELILNGIDADNGDYLTRGITTEMIAKIARGQKLDPTDLRDVKIRKSLDAMTKYQMGVGEGIDASDLSQAGWSVIFPSGLPQREVDAIKDALKPLLDHRTSQAAAKNPNFYKEAVGINGHRQGESKNDFLKRFDRGPGAVDPKKFPYYVLIVGDPEAIPFSFQYQLDIQYAVGRIHFDKLEDYYQYATSVVRTETEKQIHARKAAFFGVANPNDTATRLSSQHLIKPLVQSIRTDYKDWDIDLVLPENSTKSTLTSYLGGINTPSLLFSASHGIGFKLGDPRQLRYQGALLCQDWPGPKVPITDKFYFSADDVPHDANVFGVIAFFFACYGGGTPKVDNFYHQIYGTPNTIAPKSFLAQLPLRLLSHPNGGALAVFAHVERAWTTSIIWDQTVRDVTAFDNMIKALLNGLYWLLCLSAGHYCVTGVDSTMVWVYSGLSNAS
jgi:hypothetical protein